MNIKKNDRKFMGSAGGHGRVSAVTLEDGSIDMKMRVRDPGDPLGVYHRVVITPDDDARAKAAAHFPAHLCAKVVEPVSGKTVLDDIEAAVTVERTPLRLQKWSEKKKALLAATRRV